MRAENRVVESRQIRAGAGPYAAFSGATIICILNAVSLGVCLKSHVFCRGQRRATLAGETAVSSRVTVSLRAKGAAGLGLEGGSQACLTTGRAGGRDAISIICRRTAISLLTKRG